MKNVILVISFLFLLFAVVSCEVVMDLPETAETGKISETETNAISYEPEKDASVTEAETLRDHSETLPDLWPKETAEAMDYPMEPSENSSAEHTSCTVSLTYTELLQGDRLAVDIAMTVNGEGYTAYTAYLRNSSESGTVTDIPVKSHVDMFFYADIPADAACGAYDLVVKADAIGYEGVLTSVISVEARERTEFSFAYKLEKNTYTVAEIRETWGLIKLAVINEGDPFILYDNDYVYNVSEACLTKTENGVTVTYPLHFMSHTAEMWEVQYIAGGEPSVESFFLDEPNPEPGVYDLVVSYGGSQQIFEDVLRITE